WFLRLINYVLDNIFLAIIASVLISSFMPEILPQKMEDVSSTKFMSILYPLQFVYYFAGEYFFGKTPAKLFTKTYVTTEYHEKPGLTAILIRTLVRYIPFEYLTFLRNGIGWHDRFSKTYVVRAPQH